LHLSDGVIGATERNGEESGREDPNPGGENNKRDRRERAIVTPPNMVAIFVWLEFEC
jgi:hypothetical protein